MLLLLMRTIIGKGYQVHLQASNIQLHLLRYRSNQFTFLAMIYYYSLLYRVRYMHKRIENPE